MSFDGLVTRAVTNELKEKILGAKIQKISQPSKNDLVLNIYSRGSSFRLLISANNNEARVNLTNKKFENPDSAPNFCMVLRKYISQGKIVDIKQVGLDRIIVFSISSLDEMGFGVSKKLVVEIMGKYSNIILIDEDNRIIDSIKRVNSHMSSVREILPGLTYTLPENNKIDILADGFDKDIKYFDQKLSNSTTPYKFFYTYYTGLSPCFGKEICYRANIDPRIKWDLVSEDEKNKLNDLLYDYINKIKNNDFEACAYLDGEKVKEYYAFRLSHLHFEEKLFDTISEAVEIFYSVNKTNDRVRQIKNDLQRKVKSNIKTVEKKIAILNQNLEKTNDLDDLKKKGDLLAANTYKFEKGMKEVEVEDFYNQGETLKINLDIMLNPWENVNSYYKRYKKIKNSIDFAKNDLPKQKEYLTYLVQLIDYIERAESVDDVEEIRMEIFEENLINKKSKNKQKVKKSNPLHFVTIDNSHIYVGKNSKQNDYITLKLANKNDYFFHVKDLPGSHVILKTENLNENDIKAASYLAAKYSSVRDEDKVDVDYTEKKNVYKAKGAKAGMVYYNNFKTITVNTKNDIDSLIEK